MKKNKHIHELISFKLADKLFAIDINALVEVLEPVVVSPLPLVPDFIDGLVNINGQILPQLDLFKFLYPDAITPADSELPTLLVVKVGKSAFALKVNALQEPVSLSEEFWLAIDEAGAAKPETDNDYLCDIDYNEQTLTIFDVSVVATLVRSEADAAEHAEPGFLGERTESVSDELKLQEFLIVKLAGYEYALALHGVMDVVDVQQVKRLPHSPEVLLGIALVRGLPRLVLSLAALLEAGDALTNLSDASLVMIRVNGIVCGLQVDEVLGLELLAESQLCRNDEGELLSLIRGDDHSVTEVAHIEQLLSVEALNDIKPFMPEIKDQQEERIQYVDLLCFNLDGDRYALAIADIKRIIYNKKVQALLEPHPLLKGTLEFDGKVIPVLDVVAQLGYPSVVDAGDALFNEFIVVSAAGSYWALAVGSSDQIVSVPEKSIDAVSAAAAKFVLAFSRVDEQLLTVLSVPAICHDKRIKQAKAAYEPA